MVDILLRKKMFFSAWFSSFPNPTWQKFWLETPWVIRRKTSFTPGLISWLGKREYAIPRTQLVRAPLHISQCKLWSEFYNFWAKFKFLLLANLTLDKTLEKPHTFIQEWSVNHQTTWNLKKKCNSLFKQRRPSITTHTPGHGNQRSWFSHLTTLV